jgi:hypothetical protein
MQALANTPTDSPDRFRSRALLPGMAGRLRAVGPSVAALLPVLGETDDKALSARYGGEATTESPAEDVYRAIGRAITISGRCVQAGNVYVFCCSVYDRPLTLVCFQQKLLFRGLGWHPWAPTSE